MPAFAQRLAAERPDEAALVDDDHILGWGEVDTALNRAANLLLDADLGRQRRVAVSAENAAETESAVMVPTHFVRLLALPEEVRKRYDVSSRGLRCERGRHQLLDHW